MPLVLSGTNGISSNGTSIAMRPDDSGRVLMPNQVYFLAINSDQAGDGITTNPFRFNNVITNRGGGFNTSTFNRFTAPVSGVYMFNANPGYKQTSVDFVCRIYINGSSITDFIRLIGAPNSHSGGAYSFMRFLNANDFVELNSEGATYHRNNGSVPNYWSGYLLG
jgi:hypothetical protein